MDEMTKTTKVELFHDGEKTYFYDTYDQKLYVQMYNTLECRKKTQKYLSRPLGYSVGISLLAVAFNRWYMLRATVTTNILLFIFISIVTFIIYIYLKQRITTHEKNLKQLTFLPQEWEFIDVADLLGKSAKTVKSSKNIMFLCLAGIIGGVTVFFCFSVLVGLVVASLASLIFALFSHGNFLVRDRVVKELRQKTLN